ncbi:MAG: glycosyltransferase family 2 protein [Ginsengibacter sp.]
MVNVFTIIVTYNGKKWIKSCIDSLLKSTHKSTIVVVDNDSNDHTNNILSAYGDKIQLLQNDYNEGFGSANNRGILYALEQNADMVFLLNQDAYVFENTIELLVKAMKENPDFGIMSPLHLEAGGKTLDADLKNYITRDFSAHFAEKLLTTDPGKEFSKPYPMRFINAAAWMISKECLLKTGLFHPVFFHYGEDNHFVSRTQYHGFKTGLLPEAKVIHDREISIIDPQKLLLRQLRTVPLYVLLDLRKPLFLARFLARRKLKRISMKLHKLKTPDIEPIIKQQEQWFSSLLPKARKIRKETKAGYTPEKFFDGK